MHTYDQEHVPEDSELSQIGHLDIYWPLGGLRKEDGLYELLGVHMHTMRTYV